MVNYIKKNKDVFIKPESKYHIFDCAKKAYINNFSNLSGRARRSEYWYTVLANLVIQISLILLGVIFYLLSPELLSVSIFIGIIYVLYSIAIIIPGLAMIARRLHDIGKSGWFYLITFVPFVGGIIIIVFLATDSEPGENKWGPKPKNIGNKELDLIGKE